jgi:hypothetical protein
MCFPGRISQVLRFILICRLFTDSTSYKCSQQDISKSLKAIPPPRVPQQPLTCLRTATACDKSPVTTVKHGPVCTDLKSNTKQILKAS